MERKYITVQYKQLSLVVSGFFDPDGDSIVEEPKIFHYGEDIYDLLSEESIDDLCDQAVEINIRKGK